MARWLVVVLALAVAPAAAQTVQKCIGKGGAVTLTSSACPAGQELAASYDAPPERLTAQQLQRQAELRQLEREQAARRAAQRNTVYYSPPQRSVQNSRHQRCDDAKRWRDAQAERVGLRRTHDMLRAWDDYVYQQCK